MVLVDNEIGGVLQFRCQLKMSALQVIFQANGAEESHSGTKTIAAEILYAQDANAPETIYTSPYSALESNPT